MLTVLLGVKVQAPLVSAPPTGLAGLTGNVLSVAGEELGFHVNLAVKVTTVPLTLSRALAAEVKAGTRCRLEMP